jgi:hypothetical protein
MTYIINKETPIALLTVGQLMDLWQSEKIQEKQEGQTEKKSITYVYGLRGIRKLFDVSHATAYRYKETIIKDAVSQNGRKIITNAEMAIELFNLKTGRA